MTEVIFPERSPHGLAALDVFFDDFNDVHFFVEDADQENLYEIVIGRMFPDITIARIFPLGGKSAVLLHSQEPNTRVSAPRSVYLLDKDFDDLLGKIVHRENLFYLDRYCIENYLIDVTAIVEVVVETHPKLKRADISNRLEIDLKIPEITGSLRPLFELFFCAQYFSLDLKNCSLAIEKFCLEKSRWQIDGDEVDRFRTSISERVMGYPQSNAFDHPDVLQLSALDSHTVVSGKHLCTLIFHYIKSKYPLGNITFESFLFRVAKNCPMLGLVELREKIRASLNSESAFS